MLSSYIQLICLKNADNLINRTVSAAGKSFLNSMSKYKCFQVPDLSLTQLMSKVSLTAPTDLLTKFEEMVHKLAKGKPCAYFEFFERLNAPIKDSLGNELTEFTVLNKTSVIGMVIDYHYGFISWLVFRRCIWLLQSFILFHHLLSLFGHRLSSICHKLFSICH